MANNIVEAQKFFQSQKGFVHLKKGGVDRLTSVIIPLGAVVLCTGMLLKGMDDLYNGKNKKPGF